MLNPGCPAHDGYFDISDIVVVSERSHQSCISPLSRKWTRSFFKWTNRSEGLNFSLPKASIPEHNSKFGIIDHSFLPGQAHELKLIELRKLVENLVCTRRVGAVFITDVDLEKADVYAEWSSIWSELLAFMERAATAITFRNQGAQESVV